MGAYLTFIGSTSLASSNTPADENYAREIMQLFTIGLYELEEDGTFVTDSYGIVQETYDTTDIQEFAKAWTGFNIYPMRENIQHEGHAAGNRVDPLWIKGNGRDTKRDLFPKSNLYDGHLGDGAPLCADLPPRHFLSKGARWSYRGQSKAATKQPEAIDSQTITLMLRIDQYAGSHGGYPAPEDVPRLRPDPASALYRELCGVEHGPCKFRSEIDLPETLQCHGEECAIDTAVIVDVVDPHTNTTVHYEYVRRPCVELTFFDGATIRGPLWNAAGQKLCADPATEAAAAACCQPGVTDPTVDGRIDCKYQNEALSYATAVARCGARSDGYTEVWYASHACSSAPA